jgi:predicted outer membrane protein
MLDMNEDEALDVEAAEQWGSQSTLDGFLKFARKMNELLPEEFKKPLPPLKE